MEYVVEYMIFKKKCDLVSNLVSHLVSQLQTKWFIEELRS